MKKKSYNKIVAGLFYNCNYNNCDSYNYNKSNELGFKQTAVTRES